MTSTACRTGDRTSQRVTALENELEAFRRELGEWQTFDPGLWTVGYRRAEQKDSGGLDQVAADAFGSVNLGTGGSRTCWYLRIGDRLHVRYAFQWGQPPWDAGAGRVITSMPPGTLGATSGSQYLHCHLWTTSGNEGNMDFLGSALVHPTGREYVQPMFPFSAVDCRLGHYAIAGPAPGQRDWSVPYIASGWPEGGILAIQGTLDISMA